MSRGYSLAYIYYTVGVNGDCNLVYMISSPVMVEIVMYETLEISRDITKVRKSSGYYNFANLLLC